MAVLANQQVLFDEVASAATANRTIAALAEGELVIEQLADALRAARERVWNAGGAPPVVTAALAAATGEPDAQGRPPA